jgi:choice-of-anchor A domain-containing protein
MKLNSTLAGTSLAPVIASALLAFAANASAQSLGAASDYNYFVFGDVTLSNTDVEGRAAIGGNATFNNYGVGDKLTSNNGYSLVVDGNLSYTNGQVFHGSVIHGGSITSSGLGVPNGSIVKGDYIDFDAAESQLKNLSNTLAGVSTTGTTSNSYGSLSFNGSSSSLNVFSTQGSVIDSAHNFQVYAPAGSTVLINIAGQSVTWDNMSVGLNGVENYNVIYNFYEATSLNMSGIGINGSVLAPKADVIFNNGQFNGTLVAKSLAGNGEFHHTGFQGALPVPEPSSFALAIGSIAGLLLFRRRSI